MHVKIGSGWKGNSAMRFNQCSSGYVRMLKRRQIMQDGRAVGTFLSEIQYYWLVGLTYSYLQLGTSTRVGTCKALKECLNWQLATTATHHDSPASPSLPQGSTYRRSYMKAKVMFCIFLQVFWCICMRGSSSTLSVWVFTSISGWRAKLTIPNRVKIAGFTPRRRILVFDVMMNTFPVFLSISREDVDICTCPNGFVFD